MRRPKSISTISFKRPEALLDLLQFNEQGLIPAVIQDEKNRRVITLCYMNREALEKTFEEGLVYVYRRSQQRLMLKGETSGHIQVIKRVEVDCEGKSLILHVKQHVGGCHAGYQSCYYRELTTTGRIHINDKKTFDPDKVYKKQG
jgi:phosphoribosyl-AMP cyclohydrolase